MSVHKFVAMWRKYDSGAFFFLFESLTLMRAAFCLHVNVKYLGLVQNYFECVVCSFSLPMTAYSDQA